jgi:sugar phosphate isomerase/epimerase
MKPISIQLYTVRELTKDGNHLSVLQRIADIGYKGVEGHGYGMTPQEFRRTVEDMGMVVSSYFGPMPTPETVNEFIDTAKTLGVSHTVSGFWIPDFESQEAIERTAEKVNAVLPTILESGLTFCLHNHWPEFERVDGRLAIEWLLERCPGLNLELDIYWASAFGENKSEEMVAKFRDVAPLLHVKDGPLVKGEPMVAAGNGKVDIPAALAAANPDKLAWLIVELDEYAGDMMEAVEASYRYLVGNGFAQGNK